MEKKTALPSRIIDERIKSYNVDTALSLTGNKGPINISHCQGTIFWGRCED